MQMRVSLERSASVMRRGRAVAGLWKTVESAFLTESEPQNGSSFVNSPVGGLEIQNAHEYHPKFVWSCNQNSVAIFKNGAGSCTVETAPFWRCVI
jgi:hypothetical protein